MKDTDMFDQKFDIKKIQNLTKMIGVSFDKVSEPSGDYYGNRIEKYGEFLKDGGSTGLGIQEINYNDSRKEFKLVCNGKKNKTKTLSEILQVEVTRLEESLVKKKNKKAETHRKNIQFIAMLARTNNLIEKKDNTTQDQFDALVEGVKKRQEDNEKIKFPGVIKMEMLTKFEKAGSKVNRKWIRLLRVRVLEASEKEKEENSEYAMDKKTHGKNRNFLKKIKGVIEYAEDGDEALDSLLTDIEQRQKGRVLDIGNSDKQRKLQEIERKVLEDKVKNIKITRSRLAFTRIGAGGDFSEVLPLKALNILSELLKKRSAADLEFNKKVESLKQLEKCSGKADAFDSKVTETCKGWIESKLDQLEKKELKKQAGLFTDESRAKRNRSVLDRAKKIVKKIENMEQMEALQGWVTAVDQRQRHPGMDLSNYLKEFNDLDNKTEEDKLVQLKEMKDMMQVHPDIMPLLVKEENKSPFSSTSIERIEANIECLQLASRMKIKIDGCIGEEFINSVKEKQDQRGLNLSNSIFYLKAIEKLESAKGKLTSESYQEALNKLTHELQTSIQESSETKTEFIYDESTRPYGECVVVIRMENEGLKAYKINDEKIRSGQNSVYGRLDEIQNGKAIPTKFGLLRTRGPGLSDNYKYSVVEHLGDPLKYLKPSEYAKAVEEGVIEALYDIGNSEISAVEGELNGDLKLDNILYNQEEGNWSIIDKNYEKEEPPRALYTGMLIDEESHSSGSESTESERSTLVRAHSEAIGQILRKPDTNHPFELYENSVQKEIAEMVVDIETKMKENNNDYLSQGLNEMKKIIDRKQVVHDSFAFCTLGRMMAKRSQAEVKSDSGAKHLEQVCIEKQKEMLIALADKMKKCAGREESIVEQTLTQLSTEFSPDKVRDEVIKRAKHLEKCEAMHLEKCEAIIHAKDLAEWMKDGHKDLTEKRHELIERLHNHEFKEGENETESDTSSNIHQEIRKHLSEEFDLMHQSVYKEYLASKDKHEDEEKLGTEIEEYFSSLNIESLSAKDFDAGHARKRKDLEEAREKVREFTEELEKAKRGGRDNPDHPIKEILRKRGAT